MLRKVFSHRSLNSIKKFFLQTVCGTPPRISRGHIVDGPEIILVGTNLTYQCDDGYFAHGVNSDQLSTRCLDDGTYSLEKESLALCAPIS